MSSEVRYRKIGQTTDEHEDSKADYVKSDELKGKQVESFAKFRLLTLMNMKKWEKRKRPKQSLCFS